MSAGANGVSAMSPPSSPWLVLVEPILRSSGYVLFFMMLFVPTAYQPIKGVLLTATVAMIGLRILGTGRIALHPMVAALACVYAAIGLFFGARGAIAGEPGAVRMMSVYVLWPTVYTVLVAGVADLTALYRLFRILVWASVAVCLYSVHYVLWELGWWPDAFYLALDQGQGFSVFNGSIEFNLYSISSLIFLVPFLTAAAVYLPRDGEVPVARATLWFALGFGMLVTLLTGRRGLLVVVPLGPLVGFVLWMCLPGRVRWLTRKALLRSAAAAVALAIGVLVYLDLAHGLTVRALVAWVATGFDFAWDPVARLRADQSAALIGGWLKSPWLGSGHGAPAPGLIRAPDMPWAYELSYLALLYHTGLLGVTAYAAGAIWIFGMGMFAIRSGLPGTALLLPILTGTSAFLAANATNPYLEKYDFLWVIFLPIAFINYWLLNAPERAASSPGRGV